MKRSSQLKRSGFKRRSYTRYKTLKKASRKRVKLIKIGKLQKGCDALIQQIGRLKYPRSEVSGQPTEVIHHICPKSVSNALRYDWDNLVALTNGEHMRHHQAGDPLIHGTILFKRGQDWWDKLLQRRYKESIKVDRAYYEAIIERLNKELESYNM